MFPYAYYKEHYTKPIECTALIADLLKIKSNILTVNNSNVVDLGYKSVGNIDTSSSNVVLNDATSFSDGSFVLITKRNQANQLTIKHGGSFLLSFGKDLVVKQGKVASLLFYATTIAENLVLVQVSDSFGPTNPIDEVIVYNKNPILTVKVLDQNTTDIDWSASANQYKTITANTTFSFSNAMDGQQMTMVVSADATNRTATFPSVRWKEGTAQGVTVLANKQNLYSFIKINGNIYATCIEEF